MSADLRSAARASSSEAAKAGRPRPLRAKSTRHRSARSCAAIAAFGLVWPGQAEAGAISRWGPAAPAGGARTAAASAAKRIARVALPFTAPKSRGTAPAQPAVGVPWVRRRKEKDGDEGDEIRAGVARAADAGAVRGDPQGRHRARLHGPVRG